MGVVVLVLIWEMLAFAILGAGGFDSGELSSASPLNTGSRSSLPWNL